MRSECSVQKRPAPGGNMCIPSLKVSRLGAMTAVSPTGFGPDRLAKRACDAEEASERSPGASTTPSRSAVGNGNMHLTFANDSLRRLKPSANQPGAAKYAS